MPFADRLAFNRLVGGVLLAAGILISIALAPAPGTLDVTNPRYGFLSWMNDVVEDGITGGYRSRPYDYPPGTKVLLGVAASVGGRVGASRATSFKALLFFFHWLTFGLVLVASRDLPLAGAVYLFTALGTVGLGYLDILYSPFLMASLFGLVRQRPFVAWGFLCVACVIKPQPAILAPFYLVYLGRLGSLHDVRRVLRESRMWLAAAAPPVAGLLLVLTFGRAESGQWAVIQALQKATAHHEISGQALNAGWIGSYVYGVAASGEFGAATIRDSAWTSEMKVVAASIVAWILWVQIRLPRTPQNAVLAMLAGYLAYFTFNAGVHENHLFVAMLLALLLAAGARRPWPAAAGPSIPDGSALSATAAVRIALAIVVFAHLNLVLFYGLAGTEQPPMLIGGPGGLDASVPLALFSIVLFVVTVRCLSAAGRAAWPAAGVPVRSSPSLISH